MNMESVDMNAKAVHNLFYFWGGGGQLVHTHALIIPMGFLRHAASPVHSDAQFFLSNSTIIQCHNTYYYDSEKLSELSPIRFARINFFRGRNVLGPPMNEHHS